MKKSIFIIAWAVAALSAQAQSWQDALLLSDVNYGGTARSMGMGNALTAVGSDPGSIVLNPAGSAVAAYSQFFISPGLSISATTAQGMILDGKADPAGLGNTVHNGYTRLKMPSLGFTIQGDTGRRSGCKRISFGLVLNSTDDYTGKFLSSGLNYYNSFAGSLASSADGYNKEVLAREDWFYDGERARMPYWTDMIGYRSGMINAVKGFDNVYQAVTEIQDGDGNFRLAAPVYQEYGQQVYGGKRDLLFNMALDFSDRLYLGLNLGFTGLNYQQSEYWFERPNDPSEFPAVKYEDGTSGQFGDLTMKKSFRLVGSGVYLKAGAIWRPFAGLRLAAAFQTPTVMNLTERCAYTGRVNMTGKYLSPSASPESEGVYALRTPGRITLGAAYSFGSVALLSADYELADYRANKFYAVSYEGETFESSLYTSTNNDIRDFMGWGHQLRAGFELRPVPALALRTGYNYITSPERGAPSRSSVSFGLGYALGPLYADLAVRLRFDPASYYTPYYYYAYDDDYTYKYVDEGITTPEVQVSGTLINAMLTLGWRF